MKVSTATIGFCRTLSNEPRRLVRTEKISSLTPRHGGLLSPTSASHCSPSYLCPFDTLYFWLYLWLIPHLIGFLSVFYRLCIGFLSAFYRLSIVFLSSIYRLVLLVSPRRRASASGKGRTAGATNKASRGKSEHNKPGAPARL